MQKSGNLTKSDVSLQSYGLYSIGFLHRAARTV